MSLSALAGFAGPLDELLLLLGGKTSLSDVASPHSHLTVSAVCICHCWPPACSGLRGTATYCAGMWQSVVIHHP